MSAENAWEAAKAAIIASPEVFPETAAAIEAIPMPPAFRAEVEAEARAHWYQQAINAREMASAWEKEARAKAAEAEELRGMLADEITRLRAIPLPADDADMVERVIAIVRECAGFGVIAAVPFVEERLVARIKDEAERRAHAALSAMRGEP